MNVDGTQVRRLTNGPGQDLLPTSSPDGESLVFSSDRSGNFELFRLTLSSGALQNLANNLAYDTSAAYSPDGKLLAFASNREGLPQIYLLNLATLAVTRVTHTDVACGAPDWKR